MIPDPIYFCPACLDQPPTILAGQWRCSCGRMVVDPMQQPTLTEVTFSITTTATHPDRRRRRRKTIRSIEHPGP